MEGRGLRLPLGVPLEQATLNPTSLHVSLRVSLRARFRLVVSGIRYSPEDTRSPLSHGRWLFGGAMGS